MCVHADNAMVFASAFPRETNTSAVGTPLARANRWPAYQRCDVLPKSPLKALFLATVLIAPTLWPATAHAQFRGRTRVVVVGRPYFDYGYYYDPFFFYDPLFLPYQWGPYPPYGYPRVYDNTASVRVQVKPKEAEVYVDGYYAGLVDDFDGIFQRLHLPPGPHDI